MEFKVCEKEICLGEGGISSKGPVGEGINPVESMGRDVCGNELFKG